MKVWFTQISQTGVGFNSTQNTTQNKKKQTKQQERFETNKITKQYTHLQSIRPAFTVSIVLYSLQKLHTLLLLASETLALCIDILLLFFLLINQYNNQSNYTQFNWETNPLNHILNQEYPIYNYNQTKLSTSRSIPCTNTQNSINISIIDNDSSITCLVL